MLLDWTSRTTAIEKAIESLHDYGYARWDGLMEDPGKREIWEMEEGYNPILNFDEYTNTLDARSSFLREEGTLSIDMNDGF
ncbi:hypothetical protein NC651_036119 [Populus alba x Populus x berolinensis]|nr:hypothetical protein NC651_036119 [Populus alba x Populus x berolinensis]